MIIVVQWLPSVIKFPCMNTSSYTCVTRNWSALPSLSLPSWGKSWFSENWIRTGIGWLFNTCDRVWSSESGVTDLIDGLIDWLIESLTIWLIAVRNFDQAEIFSIGWSGLSDWSIDWFIDWLVSNTWSSEKAVVLNNVDVLILPYIYTYSNKKSLQRRGL